jgi:hypothetical protein
LQVQLNELLEHRCVHKWLIASERNRRRRARPRLLSSDYYAASPLAVVAVA